MLFNNASIVALPPHLIKDYDLSKIVIQGILIVLLTKCINWKKYDKMNFKFQLREHGGFYQCGAISNDLTDIDKSRWGGKGDLAQNYFSFWNSQVWHSMFNVQ